VAAGGIRLAVARKEERERRLGFDRAARGTTRFGRDADKTEERLVAVYKFSLENLLDLIGRPNRYLPVRCRQNCDGTRFYLFLELFEFSLSSSPSLLLSRKRGGERDDSK
jgi:hypothetical protein